MALISYDISDLINNFEKIKVEPDDKPQVLSNCQDNNNYCFEDIIDSINNLNKRKKNVKTIKCKSFTKNVAWKILLFNNPDITRSCRSFKNIKFNKYKHIK